MTTCVGAFRAFDCPNETEQILCDSCHAKVARVMHDLQPKAPPAATRRVYRKRNGVPAA